LQTADKQPSANEEHHGERGLNEQQRAPRRRSMHVTFAHAFFQGAGQLRAARLKRRGETGEHSRRECGERRVHQDSAIDRRINPLDVGEQHTPYELAAPPNDEDRCDTAKCAEHEALEHEQANQAPASNAQRHAQRNLAPAFDTASEQEVRHVGAGEEQHEQRDCAQQERHFGIRAGRSRMTRQRRRQRDARVALADPFRIDAGADVAGAQRSARTRLPLRRGDIGAQPTHDTKPEGLASFIPVAHLVGRNARGQRNPDVDRALAQPDEALRRNTDDGVSPITESD
jgi:hypothetical protein